MKLNFLLFFVGLWKLKENNKNYIVNLLKNGKLNGFEENNIYPGITGYWEDKDNELSIFTNESKSYKAAYRDLNIVSLEGHVCYGIYYPDYLHTFRLLPVYRKKVVKKEKVRSLKHTSSFVGKWLFEQPLLTSVNSVKKVKIENKRIYQQINNENIYNFPIINLITLNSNGTWSYNTLKGNIYIAGKWNIYNYSIQEDTLNFNQAFIKNNLGENIWLKKYNDDFIFMGSNIYANNTKINGTSAIGEIETDYSQRFYISKWFNDD